MNKKMNWVGGARNRLKLKHENKLQKEFFERKRQQKNNVKSTAPREVKKIKARSQDLFSLEVIMSAHKSAEKTGGSEASSSWKKGHAGHNNSKVQGVPTKQHRQHSIPELSPIRPQIDIEQETREHFINNYYESLGTQGDQKTLSRKFVTKEDQCGWSMENYQTDSRVEHGNTYTDQAGS